MWNSILDGLMNLLKTALKIVSMNGICRLIEFFDNSYCQLINCIKLLHILQQKSFRQFFFGIQIFISQTMRGYSI